MNPTDEAAATAARRRKAIADAIDGALAADGDFAEGIGEALGVVVAAHLDAASLLDLTCGAVKRLGERVAELEKQAGGLQKRIDHAAKALHFTGTWQTAMDYSAGAVVRHRGTTYTALVAVRPGKAEPGRQGSGWDRLL